MRFLLSFLLFFTATSIQAQLLQAYSEWFELESFFSEKAIAQNKIRQIHIESQDKLDGAVIKKGYDQLDYYFNRSGRLSAAHQVVRFSKRMDTSKLLFAYDAYGRVYKKQEVSGPFNFTYYYTYRDSLLVKELKIEDGSMGRDTLYQRTYQYVHRSDGLKGICFNEAQKPFLEINKVWKNEQVLERLTFLRSGFYTEQQWTFQSGKLIERREVQFSRQRKEKSWQFQYLDHDIEEAYQFDEAGKKKFRMSVLRGEDGLVKHVLVRDYQNKKIRIYYFHYQFY